MRKSQYQIIRANQEEQINFSRAILYRNNGIFVGVDFVRWDKWHVQIVYMVYNRLDERFGLFGTIENALQKAMKVAKLSPEERNKEIN